MIEPGRKYIQGSNKYRFGFNGKEKDNEVKGEGNQQDYGMRIYDPRLGKFLSVDPVTSEYPMLTPYQFASNRPIDGIDQDGLEWKPVTNADGNITDYTWSGFNADGRAPAGTVSGGAIVRDGTVYNFSSTSVGNLHTGGLSIDDGSNIRINATIWSGGNTSYNFEEIEENGQTKSVYASGYLGDATDASGTNIATALNRKLTASMRPDGEAGLEMDGLFLIGRGEAKLALGTFKYAAIALVKAEVRNIFRQVLTKVEIGVARRAAVRIAWKEEKNLVLATGKGTRNWTKTEIKELIKNGKVKGYQGHHINSVNGNPRLARNPDNIDFVKGTKGNLAAHNGNFQNPTSGPLKNRKLKKSP
jgi:RHS repeat-associated protein